jgi:hypothetical protein
MAFAEELDIAPRTKGRATKAVSFGTARELSTADLALLASERGVKPTAITQLRERHHALARCLAGGMSNSEASVITGYDPSRISILKSDPLFKALIEDYRTMSAGITADFVERTNILALTAVNRMQEAMEDEANPPSLSQALEVAKYAADRTGNAPTTKTQNVNVNVNLGDRLRAARERANALLRVEGPTIDAEFTEVAKDSG